MYQNLKRWEILDAIAFAQNRPLDADIQTIQNYDKIYQTPGNPILFVGSSSIRKWDDLQKTFGNYNILNRGIGGAYINEITVNLRELVFAYKARQLVLYVGENDVGIHSFLSQFVQR